MPFYDQDPLKHLTMNGLFPPQIPGSWGSTDIKTNEKFYKIAQVLTKFPTLHDKFAELYYHEDNLWYHRLNLPLDCTDTLDFSQYITRTNVHSSLELGPIYNKHLEVNNKFLRFRIGEYLKTSQLRPDSTPKEREEFLGSLMECAFTSLVEFNKNSYLRSRPTQLSVGAKVETFLKRSGFADLYNDEKIKEDCLSEGVWEMSDEVVLDAEKLLRFRICGRLAWTLRSDSPLPPFIARANKACYEDHLPKDGRLYRPEVFGFDPIDHYDFSCIPFVNNARSPEYIRSVAGFWPSSPFLPQKMGDDPCQFGLAGVLDVTPSSEQQHLYSTMDGEISAQSMSRDALSNAVLAAFAWTGAMAYNAGKNSNLIINGSIDVPVLGFTLYNELDHPFSVQLLLFDAASVTWQLVAYQLNTLSGLWKADDAGDPFNLLWHSPRIPMFNEDQVLNPEALELLSLVMLLPPIPSESSSTTAVPVRLISDSLDEETESASTSLEDGVSGGANLTPAEREALRVAESDEIARLNLPGRVATHPLPHPNEVFFLKMTQKEDLLAEMQEKMPVFGGPKNPDFEEGSELPESSREVLHKHRLYLRGRTPQNKVQRRPPRWR
nr:28S ribosomal protein S30 mitochondrial [Hymenolepis microstoma]CDS34781.1 28S ribosomal protein S30 mitochondrial [Hymenolepis microstoma]